MHIRCVLLLGLLAQASGMAAELPRAASADKDAEQVQLEQDAALAIESGMAEQAIDNALDKVITTFEQQYAHIGKQVYCARTPTESIYYMGDALNRKTGAVALAPVWCEAYKLKAHALFEPHRDPEARIALNKALAMSPENADFLEELGADYEREKNWPKALETFEHAERSANTFSPPRAKDEEVARAWRGLAFVYVELGRLDDAEAIYLKCLALDKSDKRATNELQYVRDLRAKQAQH
jgi:tetratricopeptide (TPR) repeat protein